MKNNYAEILENTIKQIKESGSRPRLLLHACCAPCSSYTLEYLNKHFNITLYFYNPNISPKEEYFYRYNELERLIREMPLENKPQIVCEDYENESFMEITKGLEDLPEGGKRCFLCYALRLERAAKYAKKLDFDYFCTTLSISPHKNAAKLNEIGGELSKKYDVPFLFSDFKKHDGYKRSIELSRQYGLYRQNYCGCVFSRNAKNAKKT